MTDTLNVMTVKCRFCNEDLNYKCFSNRCGWFICKNKNHKLKYNALISFTKKSIIEENIETNKYKLLIDYTCDKIKIFPIKNKKYVYSDMIIKDNMCHAFKGKINLEKINEIIENLFLLG